MLRRVHPKKRSVSWVNSVLRQFLPNGSSPSLWRILLKAVDYLLDNGLHEEDVEHNNGEENEPLARKITATTLVINNGPEVEK